MNTPEDIVEIEVPPMREVTPIDLHHLVVAESKRVTHHLTLAPGVRLDDLLIPDTWSLAAPKLHRRDLIEVEPTDSAWWALLLVTEVGPEFAKTVVLHKVELPTQPLTVDDLPLGTSVHFMGPRRLWAGLRGEQILRHGFGTKTDAVNWLITTLRS